jgi:glyoxylase-like metal-dependent hydrolase (beta-lactamase superfamily II)
MAQFARVQSKTVGDFKITFLPDGGGYINPAAMYPASAEKGWGDYGRFLDDQGRIVITIGGFLIETGDKKIIMDLGFGPMTVDFPGFGPFIGGSYLDSFAQTGVAREDITDVVYTHLHLDHVGWTSIEVDGQRQLTLPNARHVCTQADWDFWMGDESGMGPNPDAVVAPLKDVVQFIKGGDELASGITVLSTPGHTPGHISLHLNAGDQEVYMIADLLHSEVQFYEAKWRVVFDIDPVQGRKTREDIYPKLSQPHVMVADGHFADCVFGCLTNEDGRWHWNPLD